MDMRELTIPEQDWRKLLAAANGDSTLLYLFLRAGGRPEQAESALRMDHVRMELAVSSLRTMGLWPETPRVLRPAAPPTYTEEDLSREMAHGGSDFPQLVGEAQRRLGKVLSTEEVKVLLSFYDYLNMPTEVVSLLITYCIERARLRGGQRTPSMRTIEKEAYHWADLGIDTLAEASSYLQLELQRHSAMGRLRKSMQLTERKLTPAEERMLHQWLDWGFGEAEILKAYEKTCMNTGGLKWPYMNSILSRWHDQGLLTVDAIDAGDKAPVKPGTAPQEPSQWVKDAVTRIMQNNPQSK